MEQDNVCNLGVFARGIKDSQHHARAREENPTHRERDFRQVGRTSAPLGERSRKEQMEAPEEAGISIMQIAKQARNERGQKLFQVFRREENEVYIASLARWNTKLEGLVELERRCQELMQELEPVKRKTRSDYKEKRPKRTMKRSSRS